MARTSRVKRGWWMLLVGGALGILACSKSDPIGPGSPTGPTIREVIGTTGWFPTVAPDSNAFAEVRFDSTSSVSEPLRCTDYEGVHTRELAVLTMLAANDDIQFPGGLVQWASLEGLAPLAVRADRAGGTLALTTPAGGEITGAVTVVHGESVAAWRQNALAELGWVAPGPWTVTAGLVYNSDHLAVVAGLAPTSMTAEASQRLAVRDHGPGRAVVRLQRTHHAMNCPYPGDSRSAFAPHVTGSDLQDQMSEGNPPVWISTVDYGQFLLVLVEAEVGDAEVIAATVNSFTAAAADQAPDAGVPLVHELPGVVVSVFALGADADAAEVASAAGLDQLTDYLQTAPDDPATLPAVTALLLALRNGGPLTRGVTADISFTDCENFEPVFDHVLWAFEAADAHTEYVMGEMDTDGGGRFDYDGSTTQFPELLVDFIPDLVGNGGLALPRGRRPFLLPDVVNGHPAVEVYEITIDDARILTSELRFDGSGIVGRDYTIFIVCGVPQRVFIRFPVPGGTSQVSRLNQVNFFLHGTSTIAQHNLKVGYLDRAEMIYSHEPFLLQIPHWPEADEWHVYALSFGNQTGLALYYDGELLDADSGDTWSLLGFDGATICARWRRESNDLDPGVFWLVEVAAYLGAGDAESIRDETIRLDEKYDLGLELVR